MGIILRFAIKSSICGATIYLTNKHGLWGKGDESLQFYRKIYDLALPYKTYIPFEIPQTPPLPDVVGLSRTGWNNGVKASITFLSNLPENSVKWSNSGYHEIEKLLKQLNESK